MQYMLLVYGDESVIEELPAEELVRLEDERDVWVQDLVRSGHIRSAAGLHPASTATTLREREGRLEIIDGPFAASDGALRAYQMIECDDLDEAIAIAARYPALRAGFAMEVRPVMPL
jgi:hypothetical protein